MSSEGTKEDAIRVAENIIQALTAPVTLMGQEATVGTSIGIAMYPGDATDVDGLVKCADLAMYEARASNKNTYHLFGTQMRTRIESRIKLESDLRAAIDKAQLEMYYQPQFDNQTGRSTGVEALMRWHRSGEGIVEPDGFIPVAEEIGIIHKLGAWGLSEACRQWHDWERQGIAPASLSVNVSPKELVLGSMRESILNALSKYQLGNNVLQLEITESSMMEIPKEVITALEELREQGIRIAIDHFGTGSSSVSALISLPLDALKVDRDFIQQIETGSNASEVVSTVLKLARVLDLEIVIEGVENASQLAFVQSTDCDVIQGFLLGAPMPAYKLTEILLANQEFWTDSRVAY